MTPSPFALNREVTCRVDRDEALRYLGYSGQKLSVELEERIEGAFSRCEEVARPSWCWQMFPVSSRDGGVALDGSALFLETRGALSAMNACAVMCCTLGAVFDQEARRLAVGDATLAVAFDAAGSSLVEACADDCERAIGRFADETGLHAGQRTSPGYGDLSLGLSGDIVRALDAGKRLGLSVMASGLLVPQKSVTAFVGLFEREEDARAARWSCADCVARADCAYLRAGNPCNGG